MIMENHKNDQKCHNYDIVKNEPSDKTEENPNISIAEFILDKQNKYLKTEILTRFEESDNPNLNKNDATDISQSEGKYNTIEAYFK